MDTVISPLTFALPSRRLNSRKTLYESRPSGASTSAAESSWPFGFTSIPTSVLDGSRGSAKGSGGSGLELRDLRGQVRSSCRSLF